MKLWLPNCGWSNTMAEHHHHFKLKLPNGAEVDFGGDKDFVTEVYRDTKSAAVSLFNREAARTSKDAVANRLLASTDQQQPDLFSVPTAGQSEPAQIGSAATATAAPALGQPLGSSGAEANKPKDEKPKKPKSKPDPQKRDARAARDLEIDKILKAASFDDDIAYAAALKGAESPLDRAALVARLAQDKFCIDGGLSPAETRTILEKRFYIGQDKRALEESMKNAPTSFFVATPAPFDGRAKLYRPVMGCIDRVNKLLEPHRVQQAVPVPANEGTAAIA